MVVFRRNSKLTHLLQDSLGNVGGTRWWWFVVGSRCVRCRKGCGMAVSSELELRYGGGATVQCSELRVDVCVCGLASRRRFEDADVCSDKPERGGRERDPVLVELRESSARSGAGPGPEAVGLERVIQVQAAGMWAVESGWKDVSCWEGGNGKWALGAGGFRSGWEMWQ